MPAVICISSVNKFDAHLYVFLFLQKPLERSNACSFTCSLEFNLNQLWLRFLRRFYFTITLLNIHLSEESDCNIETTAKHIRGTEEFEFLFIQLQQ